MNRPLSDRDTIQIPAVQHPSFRTSLAVQNGVERNIMLKTWGGLGDQICAEPTLRYALKVFGEEARISLASEQPTLFEHLQFAEVWDLKKGRPNWENYLVFDTITPCDESNLVWQFMSHMLVNCVDFPALCAFRAQLPVADREIHLPLPNLEVSPVLTQVAELKWKRHGYVALHAGRHWPSKTFPKVWWDEVISRLLRDRGLAVILIGSETDDNRGTVDIDPTGCLDLRGKTSVSECVEICKQAAVVVTNDSSPIHMAAAGDAYIAYVATCKHPDFITHWRNGIFGWRMKNFGRGGFWEIVSHLPNKSEKVEADQVDPKVLASWLPDPDYLALCVYDATKSDDIGTDDAFEKAPAIDPKIPAWNPPSRTPVLLSTPQETSALLPSRE